MNKKNNVVIKGYINHLDVGFIQYLSVVQWQQFSLTDMNVAAVLQTKWEILLLVI